MAAAGGLQNQQLLKGSEFKMNLVKWLGCFYILLATADAAIPSYIKPCNRNDPKLGECVVNIAQNGLTKFLHGDPKNAIPDLEPLFLKEVVLRQGTNQVGLNLVLKDANMHGISKYKFTNARVDLKKQSVEFDMANRDGLHIDGNYTVSGKVLLLPISGAGKADMRTVITKTTVKCRYELIKKNGKDYLKFNSVAIHSDLGKTTIKLDNLFNGDKLLGDNMNQVINENSKELAKDFEPVVSGIVGKILKNILNAIFSQVPYDEAFPNK